MKFLSKKHRRMLFFSMQHHRPDFSFSSISRVFHLKALIATSLMCLFLLMNIYALLSGQYLASILSVPVLIYAIYKMPHGKKPSASASTTPQSGPAADHAAQNHEAGN